MFSLTSRPQLSASSSHQRAKSTPFVSRQPISSFDYPNGILSPPPAATSTPCKPRSTHKRTLTSTSPAVPLSLESLTARSFEPGRSSQHPPLSVPASVFSASDISFDLSPPQSPPLSPTKDKWSFLSTFKGDRAEAPSPKKTENKSLRLADWFQGESAPHNITILPAQVKEDGNIEEIGSAMNPPPLQRRSTPSRRPESPTKPSSTAQRRFAFLTGKRSPSQPSLPKNSERISDEFANLDIRNVLQPQGQSDPFSPSSFKNLLQNAEGLLSRMQAAYKQRIQAVEEANAEVEALAEETEEAQTRARHLKLQLNEISAKNAEQDVVIMGLVEELAKEKQARRQDAEARARTVRVIDISESQDPPRRTRSGRVSSGSTVSDSGFESNDDSVDASSISEQDTASVNTPGTPQSVFSASSWKRADEARINARNASYQDPRAIHPPGSWGAVSIFREENTALKQRVAHLETELEACLDLVNGLV